MAITNVEQHRKHLSNTRLEANSYGSGHFLNRRRYGARRISIELKERGESCSRSKARKIMEQAGLVAIRTEVIQATNDRESTQTRVQSKLTS